MDELIGKTIDRYVPLEFSGAGSYGSVYKSEHTGIGAIFALKKIHPHIVADKPKQELINEAKITYSLDHPNIAKVHDCFEFENNIYIAYEFIEGKTLEKILLDEKTELSKEQFFNYSIQLLSGLSYAHEHNVVHRDISLKNVMLTPQEQIKLTDFGQAILINDSSSQSHHTSQSVKRTLSEDTKNPKFDVYCAGDVVGRILEMTKMDDTTKDKIYLILNNKACTTSQERRCNAKEFLDALKNKLGGLTLSSNDKVLTHSYLDLEWEETAKPVPNTNRYPFSYNQSQRRIEKKGFTRHPTSQEVFSLIMAQYQKKLNGSIELNYLDRVANNITSYHSHPEFLCQAIELREIKGHKELNIYEFVTSLKYNIFSQKYKTKGIKYEKKIVFDVSDLTPNTSHNFSEINSEHSDLINYLIGVPFENKPFDHLYQAHIPSRITLPPTNTILPLAFNGSFYPYPIATSRGVCIKDK